MCGMLVFETLKNKISYFLNSNTCFCSRLYVCQQKMELFFHILGEMTEKWGLFWKSQLSTRNLCQMLWGSHTKIWNLKSCKITWKKWNKEHQTLSFQFFIILMFFVLFFHVVFGKISNFNKWTTKHLAEASCNELTLKKHL